MTNLSEKTGEFIDALQQSLTENTFVKISLGNYKGREENLKNVYIKRVLIKNEEKLCYTYRYKTRDIVKNHSVAEGIEHIRQFLDREFYVATLFTITHDLVFENLHDKKIILRKNTPAHQQLPAADHDRNKKRLISSSGKPYLAQLKITDEKGKVLVDEFYRTNVEGYYAIGDIVSGPALAHVASHEAITCVEKIAGMHVEAIDYGNIPGCTYTSPEIASVGMTEKAAKEAGYEVKVGKFPFTASGRASAAGAKDGFVKVIFDAKYGEWLGAHMIGENVTEMIAEVVVARKLETTGHEIIKSVHPHPTMSEAVMEAVAAAYGEVIHL